MVHWLWLIQLKFNNNKSDWNGWINDHNELPILRFVLRVKALWCCFRGRYQLRRRAQFYVRVKAQMLSNVVFAENIGVEDVPNSMLVIFGDALWQQSEKAWSHGSPREIVFSVQPWSIEPIKIPDTFVIR